MPAIEATVTQAINAAPEEVRRALSDYRTTRPAILPEQITDYKVVEGGEGTGTVAEWRLHATKKRIRSVKAVVTADENGITEKDENSTLVNRYTVAPGETGAGSTVTLTTSWTGGTGVKGFFERTFAPLGLKRIHGALLQNLADRLAATR